MAKYFLSCLCLIGAIILLSSHCISTIPIDDSGNFLIRQLRDFPVEEFDGRPIYYNGYLIENPDSRISFKRAVGPRPLRFG
uniref:COesterase domain-containing protein n=1 Tax=Strongyloides papillosus TaxID=174720 RepID=A0A0N5BAX9_STREA